MVLLIKGPLFIFARTEVGGGASFALLNKGIKIWCACNSGMLSRCCHFLECFFESMQRGPPEREVRYLRFIIERPSGLIYFPHVLAHAASNLDTYLPTIFIRMGRFYY